MLHATGVKHRILEETCCMPQEQIIVYWRKHVACHRDKASSIGAFSFYTKQNEGMFANSQFYKSDLTGESSSSSFLYHREVCESLLCFN